MAASDRTLYLKGGRTGFLFIHGLAGTTSEVRFVAQGVAKAGHSAYCCHLPGHGGTESDLKRTRWQDWAESVEAAYCRLAEDTDRVIVAGLSTGALLALHLAANPNHTIAGVVLFSPVLWYDGWAVPWYSFLIRLLSETPIRHIGWAADREPYGIKDERIRAFVLQHMLSGDSAEAGVFRIPGETLRQFVRLIDHVKPSLPKVHVPTLIIHPRDDDVASLKNVLHLQKKLGGLVHTLVLDDCYHIITVDRQRHLVVERIVAFAGWISDRERRAEASRRAPVVQSMRALQ
jgi:carboxylesterase